LVKRRQPPAPVVRAKSMMSASTDLKPTMPETTMGKNESRNTSSTFGVKPKPNQMMKSGATAILGTICRNTITGYTAPSMKRE
jgi:hypothetical protein